MAEGSREGQSKDSKSQKSKPQKESTPAQEVIGSFQDFTSLSKNPVQLESMMTDSRLNTIQRQEAASRIGQLKGNTYLSNIIQKQTVSEQSVSHGSVQRDDASPPGYGISKPYGSFWIVPDDTNQSYAAVEGEQITESAFALLEETWTKLEAGSGNLVIIEKDKDGKEHAGFKSNMLAQCAKLLSQPTGRSVVVNLVGAAKTKVIVRPTTGKLYGGGQAARTHGAHALEKPSGQAGSGSGTIVEMDPSLKDEDIKVYDKGGKEISDPVFIILGHELIHAEHNRAGRNRREQAATSGSYSNKEEEQTVATGPTTENDLRSEHGLKARHGSAGRDTRPGM